MAPSVLGSISLGYQFLWDARRKPAAIQLFIDSDTDTPVDAAHLLSMLRESWPEQAPQLVLSIQSPTLFLDVLEHGADRDPWLETPQVWLNDPLTLESVSQACKRGLRMIWRGPNAQRPDPESLPFFHKSMLALSPEEALAGVRAFRNWHALSLSSALESPVEPGHIYEGVANQLLAQHCLDQQGAWALAGWPTDDVLYRHRAAPLQPGQHAIARLVNAVEADVSMEILEQTLNDEPILAYRFLLYVNSPEFQSRHEVETVRHGLMLLGLAGFRAWLLKQLPDASNDPDLEPVRACIVARARLMEKLLDAGDEGELRREVYWCGLLSQFDLLLNQPLVITAEQIPVSERIRNALLQDAGPYAPYLAIAKSLESPDTRATHALCALHDIDIAEINRAFLRTLVGLGIQLKRTQPQPSGGLSAAFSVPGKTPSRTTHPVSSRN